MDSNETNTICVYNIPPGITKDDLARHFEEQGEVKGIAFPYRRQNNKAKITFKDATAAGQALKNKEQVINGQTLILIPEIEVSQDCTVTLNDKWMKKMSSHLETITEKAANCDVKFEKNADRKTRVSMYRVRGNFYRVQSLLAELESLYDHTVVFKGQLLKPKEQNGVKDAVAAEGASTKTKPEKHAHTPRQHDDMKPIQNPNLPCVQVVGILYQYIKTARRSWLQDLQDKYAVSILSKDIFAGIVNLRFQGDDIDKCNSAKCEFLALYDKICSSACVEEIPLKLQDEELNVLIALIQEAMKEKDVLAIAIPGAQAVTLVGASDQVCEAKKMCQEHMANAHAVFKTPESPDASPKKTSPYFKYKHEGVYGRMVFVTHQGITIKIYQGDIVKEQTDVIVNAANEALNHGGGIAEVIAKAAGPKLEEECKNIIKQRRQLNVADAVATKGGRLPCTFVVHVVGPRKSDYKDATKCFSALKQAVVNVLMVSNKTLKARSVAIPAVSSGIFGVPLDQVCRAFFEAIIEYSMESNQTMRLRDIRLVNIGYEVTCCMKSTFLERYNG
ncbi:uncharacterized protein LOC106170494 [Lingula anatina]|uniref:Uncharacterized protein LOC106170494 n=1 Tax=Lingula anatina TaxID=7574 RepID=A0A1S3J698_LINAN|nr:uncharacterized protein LOC106170494 [Lingula anatina]|eukprot:XP_013405833.1 uncharacterized protein LOC106170494 [Lingula anatina]